MRNGESTGPSPVLEQHGLHSRKANTGSLVAVEVPAQSLSPGAYLLTLGGRAGRSTPETLDQYLFRVSSC